LAQSRTWNIPELQLIKDAVNAGVYAISTLELALQAKRRKQIAKKFRELLTLERVNRPWAFEEECKLIAWIHANGRKLQQAEKVFACRAQQHLRIKYEMILNRPVA
jgi:hypothetical protein